MAYDRKLAQDIEKLANEKLQELVSFLEEKCFLDDDFKFLVEVQAKHDRDQLFTLEESNDWNASWC